MADPLSEYATRPPRVEAAPAAERRPARYAWPWLLVALLLALLLGLLASPWAERRLRAHLPVAMQETAATQAPDPRIAALEQRVRRLEQTPPPVLAGAVEGAGASVQAIQPLRERMAALESQASNLVASDSGLSSRLEQLAQEIQRVGGNAQAADQQMRELFLLSVARRMVAAGRSLSPLTDVLERSYGQQYGPAVQALTAWSANPGNRATLAMRLDNLPLDAAQAAPTGSWWERLRARFAGLVSVRGERAVTQPGATELRATARAELAEGDLPAAIRTVEKLPATSARDAWLADARLLAGAEQALDMLEESAIGRTIDTAAAIPAPGTPPPVNAPVNGQAAPPPLAH